VTDADGWAAIDQTPDGRLRVGSDRGGHAELDAADGVSQLVVSGGRTLAGRVVDAADLPVAGADVWLSHDATARGAATTSRRPRPTVASLCVTCALARASSQASIRCSCGRAGTRRSPPPSSCAATWPPRSALDVPTATAATADDGRFTLALPSAAAVQLEVRLADEPL